MNLKRESRLVRFAYSLSHDNDLPHQTSLCAFFWRAFVFVPLAWFVITAAVLFFARIMLTLGWHNKGVVAILAATVAAAIGAFYMTKRYSRPVILDTIANSTFVQGAKAIKGKFCPIITFVDADHNS